MDAKVLADAREALNLLERFRFEDVKPTSETNGARYHSELCDKVKDIAVIGTRLASFMKPSTTPNPPTTANPLESELGGEYELRPDQRVVVRTAGDEEILCSVPGQP